MGGDGRLKRQASSMTVAEIPALVKELRSRATPCDAKEGTAHLLDVVAMHDVSHNPAALVSSGAIRPLIDLVAHGNDGSQIHASSTLATIAATKPEYQDCLDPAAHQD